MDDRKDYIDLREGVAESEAVGNGPPPSAPAPVYAPPVRKGNTLIIVVIVLSAFLVFATLASVLMGAVLFSNFASSEIFVTAHVPEMIEIENSRSSTVHWGERIGSRIDVYANDFADRIEVYADDWAIDLENRIITWVDELVGFDSMTHLTQISNIQDSFFFGSFQADGRLYNTIDIDLGTSNNLQIMSHDINRLMLDSGGRNVMQAITDNTAGTITVSDADQFGGGTLSVWVPYDWRGIINIVSIGEMEVMGDLNEDIVINQIP